MVYHVPEFIEKYKSLKVFSGQSLEKTMDLTRRAFMLKSNKHDPEADVLKYDRRQSMLSKRERKPRSYVKHDTEYWNTKKCKTVNEETHTSSITQQSS